MATECSNQPSLNLFTIKFNYIKFRSPTVLVQPIHAHDKSLSSSIALIRVSPELATLVYRRIFASSEFFPEDVDMILNNKLSLGTSWPCQKDTSPIGTLNLTLFPLALPSSAYGTPKKCSS